MRFNVTELAKACEAASNRMRAEHEQRVKDKREQAEQSAEAWLERYAADWDQAAAEIKKKVRKGWPIVIDDLPTTPSDFTRQDHVAVHKPPTPMFEDWEEPKELSALRAVLATLADDVVTSQALEQLGISKQMLREVVIMLRAKSVTR